MQQDASAVIYNAKIYRLWDVDEVTHIEEIRYVGITRRSLEIRLYQHINRAFNPTADDFDTEKSVWIRERYYTNGVSIDIELIEAYREIALVQWRDRENELVEAYHKLGHRLTNMTLGGESRGEYTHSEEVRKHMREASQRRWNAPAARLAASQRSTDLWRDADYRELTVEANRESVSHRKWWRVPLRRRIGRGRRELSHPAEEESMWSGMPLVTSDVAFESPEGVKYDNIGSLSRFCADRDLDYDSMLEVYLENRDDYQGWRKLNS